MGMFDTYHVTLACPLDGVVHDSWQGKDGPCMLYDYEQGRSDPCQADEGRELAALPLDEYLAQFDDTETTNFLGFTERSRERFRLGHVTGAIGELLPPIFTFGVLCGDHSIDAVGETDAEGVWVTSRVTLVEQSLRLPEIESWLDFGDGRRFPQHAYERLTLFRAGHLDAAAVARREAYRDERRAELPAHGGSAVCESPSPFGDHVDGAPAAAWSSRFMCAPCVERRLEFGPETEVALVR